MTARLNPWLAFFQMVEAGAVPLETYPGTHKPWRCVCLGCGEIVTPRLNHIRKGEGPCGPCGNRRRSERELAEAEPQAIADMKAAGATPVESFPGTHKPWRCQCDECGEIVTPRLTNIRRGQGPCRPCGEKAHAGRVHVARDIAAQIEPGAEEPGDKRSPWTPGVLYLLRLRWEDGSSMLKLGTAYADAFGNRRARIARESGASVEVVDSWEAPRVICDWVEQQHHRAGREALARWKAAPAVEFGGRHECFIDTPWMLGRLRASVAALWAVRPDSDAGPDVDPLEIHAVGYSRDDVVADEYAEVLRRFLPDTEPAS
jgi:hypothetical protein